MSNRDDRKNRAEARAQRARDTETAADAAWQAQAIHRIPLGQPILVGHHSQRRHERDIERGHAALGKAVEATKARQAAETYAANSGYAIYVSDDDAVTALRDKLAAADAEHTAYLTHNKAARAGRSCPVTDCGGCRMLGRVGKSGPLPGYVLANSRHRIASVKQQLAAAEAHAAAAEAAEAAGDPETALAAGDGWTLTHAVVEARVRFTFDGRPDADKRALLKGAGFRWAPSVGAWQRHDTANGLAVARALADRL